MPKKKQRERYVIEKFFSHESLGLLVRNIANREKPDFQVNLFRDKISVELTQLINTKQKQVESFRKRIIKKAENKFLVDFATSFRVWITFSNYPMNTREHDETYFVDLIYNLVRDIYLCNQGRDFTVRTNRSKVENKYIDCIHITTEISPAWESSGAYIVEYADIEWIQAVIAKKSKLISQYMDTYDQNWLVMEASIGNKSSGYRFEHLSGKLDRERFDRVFIFESFPNNLIEIN